MTQDVYEQLALHLSTVGQRLPYRKELVDMLREHFTPKEAEVALALPTKVIPLQPVGVGDIISKVDLSRDELVDILEGLSQRGLLFSGKTKEGEKGYALIQRGFGFPQTFHWKGEKTPYAGKMAEFVINYYTSKVNSRTVMDEIYVSGKTKEHRYIPVNTAIELMTQGVYDYDMMENVVQRARVVAVAHCTCRMCEQLEGRGCSHLMEVCIKFDDMAEYVIERGFGREITKEEALEIIKKSDEDGLVHFIDNAQGDIKHNCNCCGCCCWNLGAIKRREIPRDWIIATYFISEVDEKNCNGCGKCVSVCPVDAITIDDDLAIIDKNWCVGCGLCATRCKLKATKLIRRSGVVPPSNFTELHQTILGEGQLK